MVVIGIITELVNKLTSDGTYAQIQYKVRIPVFETTNCTEPFVINCNLCCIPGLENAYSKDDKVYVTFMNDELKFPIIVGKVYDGKHYAAEGSNFIKYLDVTTNATLPVNTLFKDENGKELTNVKDIYYAIQKIKSIDYHRLINVDNISGVQDVRKRKTYKAKKYYRDKWIIKGIDLTTWHQYILINYSTTGKNEGGSFSIWLVPIIRHNNSQKVNRYKITEVALPKDSQGRVTVKAFFERILRNSVDELLYPYDDQIHDLVEKVAHNSSISMPQYWEEFLAGRSSRKVVKAYDMPVIINNTYWCVAKINSSAPLVYNTGHTTETAMKSFWAFYPTENTEYTYHPCILKNSDNPRDVPPSYVARRYKKFKLKLYIESDSNKGVLSSQTLTVNTFPVYNSTEKCYYIFISMYCWRENRK